MATPWVQEATRCPHSVDVCDAVWVQPHTEFETNKKQSINEGKLFENQGLTEAVKCRL